MQHRHDGCCWLVLGSDDLAELAWENNDDATNSYAMNRGRAEMIVLVFVLMVDNNMALCVLGKDLSVQYKPILLWYYGGIRHTIQQRTTAPGD